MSVPPRKAGWLQELFDVAKFLPNGLGHTGIVTASWMHDIFLFCFFFFSFSSPDRERRRLRF